MTIRPESSALRMSRPIPCLKRRTARGSWSSRNALPPAASILSWRAWMSGWSGTSNGSLVMITLRSARPRTSTPSQKLAVPNRTDRSLSRNFRRIWLRSPSSPWMNTGWPWARRIGAQRSATSRSVRKLVNSTNAPPPVSPMLRRMRGTSSRTASGESGVGMVRSIITRIWLA